MIWIVCLWCVFKGYNLHVLVGEVFWLVKNFHIRSFSETKNIMNVKLCMMVLHIELYLFIIFQRPWPYFKVTAVSHSFNWKFYVLIRSSRIFVELLSTLSGSWIFHYFWLAHMYSREIVVMFPDLTKKVIVGFFTDTVQAMFFKLCIPIHTRFDDIDIVSKSQVC